MKPRVPFSRLGLERHGKRWGPCPACGAERDGRRGVLLDKDTGWWCTKCRTGGDALDLVSYRLLGIPARESGPRFRDVLAWFDASITLAPEPAPPPKPQRAPVSSVAALLKLAVPPTEHGPASSFLRSRGIAPDTAPCGVLPDTAGAPFWPAHFSRNWPLVVPAYTARGVLAGLHGRAIGPAPRKSTWPKGIASAGLVFADPVHARPWLRGGPAPLRLLIVEGITDYLAAASTCDMPVLGYESGSLSAIEQIRDWPIRVIIATDNDEAGDRYARQIASALPRRVRAYRANPSRLIHAQTA